MPNVASITFVTFILQTGSLVTGYCEFMFILQGMLGLDSVSLCPCVQCFESELKSFLIVSTQRLCPKDTSPHSLRHYGFPPFV